MLLHNLHAINCTCFECEVQWVLTNVYITTTINIKLSITSKQTKLLLATLAPTPANHQFVLCHHRLIGFAFSKFPCEYIHNTVYTLLYLASLTQHSYLRFIHGLHIPVLHFFLLLSYIPLYGWPTAGSFIHLLTVIWGVSGFCQFWINWQKRLCSYVLYI